MPALQLRLHGGCEPRRALVRSRIGGGGGLRRRARSAARGKRNEWNSD